MDVFRYTSGYSTMWKDLRDALPSPSSSTEMKSPSLKLRVGIRECRFAKRLLTDSDTG